MVFKDYYKILELKTNKVSSDEIKNAYRLAVKKNHPDLNIKDNLAEEKIKDINEAYNILSNISTKRRYDRIWTRNVNKIKKEKNKIENKKNNPYFGEFVNMFFGNMGRKKEKDAEEKVPVKGENLETVIDIDIEEGFYGLDKKIKLRTVDGKMKIYTVTIPAGLHNGEKIRLIGQGKNGKNGGKSGDLFIKVNIKNNEKFKLNGNDLYTNLYLTPWEAALGTKTSIYTIDDETPLEVPMGVQSGEKIKIEGKGYKDGKGSRGNLIVNINIMVPKNLSQEEQKLFEKLRVVSSFNPREILKTKNY